MTETEKWMEAHEEELIADVCSLVRIPSISEKTDDKEAPFGKACREALEKALEIGRGMGFEAYNHENYCGSLLWRGKSAKEIGIFGHTDVVPPGSGWTYEPFSPEVTDGIILGRGTGDNKGSLMAALYGMRYLKDTGYSPENSIRFFLGCNEEKGMEDVEYYVSHYEEPEFSLVPDVEFPVCNGEKGILEIDAGCSKPSAVLKEFKSGIMSNAVPADAAATLCLPEDEAQKARLRAAEAGAEAVYTQEGLLEIRVKGIAAHAAFPEGSQSAEVKMAELLLSMGVLDKAASELMEMAREFFGDYYGAGLGIAYEDDVSGKLTHVGGMAKYDGTSFCQNINIRYPVTADYDVMMGAITERMKKHGFRLDKVRNSKPCFTSTDTAQVQKLLQICEEYLGAPQEPYVMGGGTYARKLRHAVGFGPEMPGNKSRFGEEKGGAHQPDEYVEIAHLKKAAAIYAEALKALDKLLTA